MRKYILSFVRRALNDQSGQVLPWVTGAMFALLGMAGLTVDVGRDYVVQSQLQNSTNAAALAAAGAAAITGDTALGQANLYGAGASLAGYNSNPYVTASPVVNQVCLNSLMPGGTGCSSGTPGPTCTYTICNAVKVTQKANVPTFFMGVLGIKTVAISTTATASMMTNPWNVAVIIDSTGSMATSDNNCASGFTEFQCALTGVQAMLGAVNPCPGNASSCTNSALLKVSLFTFPNVLTSYHGIAVPSLSNDINCSGSPATYATYSRQPIAAPYTLPKRGVALPGAPDATYMTYTQTSTGHPWTATYQITPFLSDWYLPSGTGKLNSSSNLVKAVGYGANPAQNILGTSGCLAYTFGIWGSGSGSGFGNTYFASSIYAAQSALAAEQAATALTRPGSMNAIIFLSDGQANASEYNTSNTGYGTATANNQYAHANEFPQGPAISEVGPSSLIANTNNPAWPATPAYYTPATSTSTTVGYSTLGLNGKGIYPDWYDQCQQAIAAAQYAVTNGTRIYSVAYGSQQSGCTSTDTTYVATGALNVSFAVPGLSPCVVMENIASDMAYFYSDPDQSGSGSTCTSAANSQRTLSQIFAAIGASFQTPRLIPNNAT
jgi:hypothetical protein